MATQDQSYNVPVYRTQNSTALFVGSGGSVIISSGGSLVIDAGATGTFVKGYLPLPLPDFREVGSTAGEMWNNATTSAGFLSTVTVPLLDCVSTTDRTMRITWSSGNSDPVQVPALSPPPDYTTVNGALTVHLNIAKVSTSNQSANIEVKFWGGLGVAVSSGVTSALTSTSPADYTVTIPSTVPVPLSAGGQWNLMLTPSAHANDAIFLSGAWVEYVKAST